MVAIRLHAALQPTATRPQHAVLCAHPLLVPADSALVCMLAWTHAITGAPLCDKLPMYSQVVPLFCWDPRMFATTPCGAMKMDVHGAQFKLEAVNALSQIRATEQLEARIAALEEKQS